MSNTPPPELGVTALAVVGAIVVLAGVVHWWLRRRGPAGDGPIRLVASRSLGGKRLLALVEVESERFLLGLTDDGIACLSRLESPPLVPPRQSTGASGPR